MKKKYDYYEKYPNSRRDTVTMSIFAIIFLTFLVFLSEFNIYKNQIIIFDGQKIKIEWYSLFKSIYKTISADEINNIKLIEI